jgi:hypothetical protein
MPIWGFSVLCQVSVTQHIENLLHLQVITCDKSDVSDVIRVFAKYVNPSRISKALSVEGC